MASTVTGNTTLVSGTHTPVDATAASVTVMLPTNVSPGSPLSVGKVDSTTNQVIVSGTIRGVVTTITLVVQYEAIELLADATGTSWWPVANHMPYSAVAARMKYRNTWTASTVYATSDVVTVNGSAYVALLAHTSGSSFSGVGTNWALLAQGAVVATTAPSNPVLNSVWIDAS